MPSLRDAYRKSLTRFGRNPSGLSIPKYNTVVIGNGGDFGGNCIVFSGEVLGGSEGYTATVVVDNPRPHHMMHKPLPQGRTDKSRWHCTCRDFRFTFYPHIDDNDFALYAVEPYIPTGTGSPRALQEFGMCKHILALVDCLVTDRAIAPFTLT